MASFKSRSAEAAHFCRFAVPSVWPCSQKYEAPCGLNIFLSRLLGYGGLFCVHTLWSIEKFVSFEIQDVILVLSGNHPNFFLQASQPI
jgi:hypothetical protein